MTNSKLRMFIFAGASLVVLFVGAKFAKAATYNPIQDGVSDGTLFEDDFSSQPNFVGSAKTNGYVFTINEPDAKITEVLKVTDNTGADETIQIWDVTNNQLVYSLDTKGTSFDWVTYQLDDPIDLEQGNQYAVLLSGGADTNFREADLDESYFGPDGLLFTDDAVSFEYSFVDRDGFTGFDPTNTSTFTTSTGGVAGVVDVGIEFASNNIAAPSPAALGLGGIMLGLIGFRRNRQSPS